jgi:hypothetical protein
VLGDAFAGVVQRMQRIAGRVETLAREVLVIGDQTALGVVQLAELGLVHRHAERRRAVVDDDVEDDLEPLRTHALAECAEIQARTRQVLVEAMEIHAPVAVVAGLAAIGPQPALDRLPAADERLVGIVDDRRDPHRAETHVADVVGIVEHALEVAAEVTDVVLLGLGARCGPIERGELRPLVAPLIALVVAGVAVDETVGDHEIHRIGGHRLGGADVAFASGVANAGFGRPGRCDGGGCDGACDQRCDQEEGNRTQVHRENLSASIRGHRHTDRRGRPPPAYGHRVSLRRR